MGITFDKGYRPDNSTHDWRGKVHMRYEGVGLDFIDADCDEEEFIDRIEWRLKGMERYHGSLDINDTRFLANRLYLGEAIILNLNGLDNLVYLGYHRRHKGLIDKFGN